MRPTRRTVCTLLGVLLFFAIFFAASGSVFATSFYSTNTSTSTGDSVGNAIKLSKKAYPSGAPAAVVTNAYDWAQAAGASVLAEAYGGPLLLSSSSSLSSGVGTELQRIRPEVVYAVGLSSTVAAQIDSAISWMTPRPEVVSIRGSNAYETTALVARQVKAKLGVVDKVVIVPVDYPGGVIAGSPMAVANGWPILLSTVDGPVPQSTEDAIAYVGATSGICVGTNVGPSQAGFNVEARLMGNPTSSDPGGRGSICAVAAEWAVGQGYSSFDHVAVVGTFDRNTAEVLSAYVAGERGVVLVANSDGLYPATTDLMRSNGTEISKVSIVGLSWGIVRQIKSLNSARVYSVSPDEGPVTGGTRVVVTGSRLDTASTVIVGKSIVPESSWETDSSSRLVIQDTPRVSGAGPTEVIVQNYWNRSPATVRGLYRYSDGTSPLPGDEVVEEAIKYLGVPYLWAGESPATGFDCSGLAMYVYQKMGINLPHYSRAQATYGMPVSKDELLPGDLVFFYNPIGHVGIYVGGGLMVNAPRSGDLVTIEDVYRSSYNTARRLIWPYTRHPDADARLATAGSWATATATSASGGSFQYLNSQGQMTVKFNGTYLGWIAKKGPQYGKARVTVDGGTPVTVDLYSSTTRYQMKVWATGLLSPGVHTVTIEWAGTKNSASSSYYISVDAFDLLGDLLQASSSSREQQDDPRITYMGDWASTWDRTCYWTDDAGAAAFVNFTGTSVALYAKTGPGWGTAEITLDDLPPQTVSFDSSWVKKDQLMYSKSGLEDGRHTLTIKCISPGEVVTIDSLKIDGVLEPGPAINRYEQDSSLLAYDGEWVQRYSDSASGRTYRFVGSSGASVNVKFHGTHISWLSKKAPNHGKALVSLDGGEAVEVDLYYPWTKYGQTVYESGLLEEGEHTLSIYCLDARNPVSSNDYIVADAFDVFGTLDVASVAEPIAWTYTYQQDDPRITYLGDWASTWDRTCYWTDDAGAAALASFTGTSVALYGKMASGWGAAEITLDDLPPQTVSFESSWVKKDQLVYSKAGLTDGPHTLTIKCASPGEVVTIDSLKIDGVLEPGPALSRYEQDSSLLAYDGAWVQRYSDSASGRTYRFAGSSGSSVNVTFNGTRISWLSKKAPNHGKALVSLDGGEAVEIDLYYPWTKYGQTVYESGLLEEGEHTLSIYCLDARNPVSSNDYIAIDAFDVFGSLVRAEAAERLSGERRVVVIDPGHQGQANYDLEPIGPGSSTMKAKVSAGTSSVNTGSPESALNLTLGLKLRDVLERYGIEVVMVRETQDVNISNAERAQMANGAGGDLFVRIHADGSTDPSVNGVLILYPATISGWTDDIASESERGALIALQELTKATGARSRGVIERSDIAGFNWSDVPVFLAEVGVMTNPTEDALLATEAYQDKIVAGIAEAVLRFLDYY